MRLPSIYIVGAGRVGAALALALREAAVPLAGLWTRSAARAARLAEEHGLPCAAGALPDRIGQAELVLVAASDPAVPALAGALLDGGLLRAARGVLHCAGGHPAAEALELLVGHLPVGTFHPLLAVAEASRGAAQLAGATITLEGDEAAVELGCQIARAVGAMPLVLQGWQLPRYHAAAVLASNHTLALVAAAQDLLQQLGLAPGRAREALAPLLRSVSGNYTDLGCSGALTGPVQRGDLAAVKRHLAALEGPARELYVAGARGALAAARVLADAALLRQLDQIALLLD